MENYSNELLKLFRKYNPSIIDYHPVMDGIYSLAIGYATQEEEKYVVNNETKYRKILAIRTGGYMLAKLNSKGEPVLLSTITFNTISKSTNGNIMCCKNIDKKTMIFYFDRYGKKYPYDKKLKHTDIETN